MAAARTFDTDLRQCLIDYFEDEDGLHWHHRLLLVRVSGSSWIAATPDHDVALLNLSNHRVIPLARNTPFPAQHVGETYAFDQLGDGEEAQLLDQARSLADFLGAADGGTEADSGSAWRVADTGHEEFGGIVPQEALTVVANIVNRGDWGLVLIDDEWTSMNRIRNDEVDDWRLDNTARAGGDPLVMPMKVVGDDLGGRAAVAAGGAKPARKVRVVIRTQAEAVRSWSRVKPPYYSLEGPPALLGFFDGLEEAGPTLNSHHPVGALLGRLGVRRARSRSQDLLRDLATPALHRPARRRSDPGSRTIGAGAHQGGDRRRAEPENPRLGRARFHLGQSPHRLRCGGRARLQPVAEHHPEGPGVHHEAGALVARGACRGGEGQEERRRQRQWQRRGQE